MRGIPTLSRTHHDQNRLDRLYQLIQQQLLRASGSRADSLLCQVLAAEADAIDVALRLNRDKDGQGNSE